MDKQLESMFQDLWNELVKWDVDDLHINIIRNKLRKIQIRVMDQE